MDIKTDDNKKIKNYKNYNNVLRKLYKQSISLLENGKAFQVFQQIAIRNKINLDELVAIEFHDKPSKTILNYLNKYLPDVIIKKN